MKQYNRGEKFDCFSKLTDFQAMTLSVVVRENVKSEYRIVLRNTSIYDVAVKIVNPNESPKLERYECLVLSNKYTEVAILETPSKAALLKNKPVDIYARAIYPYNRKNIRHWIDGHVSYKPHHLVQTLNFLADDAEYSAKTVIKSKSLTQSAGPTRAEPT